jgi:hypothetical protein
MSDLYKLQSSDIGRFIETNVQADAYFRDCCGEVIDTIVKHLQGTPGKLKPKRVLKVTFLNQNIFFINQL